MSERKPSIAVFGGGGLVGSAFVRIANERGFAPLSPRVSWLSENALSQIRSWITSDFVPFTSEGWILIWSAGVAGLNSSSRDLNQSSRLFASTLGLLAESEIDMASGTVVYMSSLGGIYGERSARPMDESVTDHVATAYGVAKLRDETMLRRFSQEYGARSVAFRLPSVFGPRPRFSLRGGFINSLASHLVINKPFHLYAPVTSRRPFLYSYDAVDQVFASLKAVRSYPMATYIPKNIVPKSEFALSTILREFRMIAGKLPPIKYEPSPGLTWETAPSAQIKSSKLTEVVATAPTPLSYSLKITLQATRATFATIGGEQFGSAQPS